MKALILALVAAAALTPEQESRAHKLEQEIRCVVCQNAPLSESTADMAGDMRALIRERIAAGDSDGEIRGFFRARYGDFVLLRPVFEPQTWLLWGAPGLLLLGGLMALFALRRRGEPVPDAEPDDR
ncbi:MAG: cytochrome c-type biogenesis protein CcmH [Hyphomonadaceae bacterium]|nr:cytochrome c-type biogenesis protein CcmH [Hyphomonadaceae bacterium]